MSIWKSWLDGFPKDEQRGKDPKFEDDLIIQSSLRGHHFVFPSKGKPGVSQGFIWAEPYLMGIARKSADAVWTSAFPSGEYALVPSKAGNHQGQLRISIESVLQPGMRVVARDHRSTQPDAAYAVGPVGLKLQELNEYLEFLGNAGGDDRVRTLVTDDSGHLLAVVTRINGFLKLGKKLDSISSLTAGHAKEGPKAPKKKTAGVFKVPS